MPRGFVVLYPAETDIGCTRCSGRPRDAKGRPGTPPSNAMRLMTRPHLTAIQHQGMARLMLALPEGGAGMCSGHCICHI